MVWELNPDLPHGHCDACYDRKCNVSPQPGNACSLMSCDWECGARFHKCKAPEHALLCPYARIECVNAIYGCPADIQRKDICRHLEVCPASVVNCTMEWNRWPVYASERQPQQPLQLVPDNFAQLDIALALRDQRMLTKSMKASKRTRQILTNALNRRHPAVPLAAGLTAGAELDGEEEQRELENLLQVMQGEKEAADRERARTPPGLQRSICNELYRKKGVAGGDEALYAPPRDPFIHCSHCVRRKERMERVMASHDAMHAADNGERNRASGMDDHLLIEEDPSNGNNQPPLPEHHNGLDCNTGDCSNGMHHYIAREDVFHDTYPEACSDNARPASLNSTFSSEDSDIHTPAVFVTQSTTGDVSAAPTRGHSKPIIIQPPAVTSSGGRADKSHRLSSSSNGSLDSRHSLSLDLSLESITRYQAKPDSMYTFLCAQEFRRDEYPYHFQNVHSDIHGGLNGWMEQRCPLAPYGCTYSQRRFYPGSHGARIVHSENLESFGLCLDGEPQREENLNDLAKVGACGVSLTGDTRGEGLNGSEGVEVGDDSGQYSCKTPLLNGDVDNVSPCVVDDSNGKENGTTALNVGIDLKCNDLTVGGTNAKMLPGEGTSDVVVSMEMDDAVSGDGSDKEESICTSKVAKLDQSLQSNGDQDLETHLHDIDHCEKLAFSQSAVDVTGSASDDVTESSFGVDHLSGLPFELLRYLLQFLDSFTINHVAMTSKLLRQVCCSLLVERGMVVLQWEKHRGHWDTTMKVWHFSTAFTPVTSWGFQDHPPIAEHLKTCPFNVRNIATAPVRVMMYAATT